MVVVDDAGVSPWDALGICADYTQVIGKASDTNASSVLFAIDHARSKRTTNARVYRIALRRLEVVTRACCHGA